MQRPVSVPISVARLPRVARAGLGGLLSVVLSGGCHFAPPANVKNLQKGIERYLAEHPDCLYKQALRFPYETSSKPEIAQLDTLVNAKLLERGTEPAIHVSRYSVSDYGAKSAPRFCYGYREVTSIESFTAPAKGSDGFIESQVTYNYKLRDVPVWAKDADVEKMFSDEAKELTSAAPATLTLAQTGAGWQVPE